MGARDIVLGRQWVVNPRKDHVCEHTGTLALAKCFEDRTHVSMERPKLNLRVDPRHLFLTGIRSYWESMDAKGCLRAGEISRQLEMLPFITSTSTCPSPTDRHSFSSSEGNPCGSASSTSCLTGSLPSHLASLYRVRCSISSTLVAFVIAVRNLWYHGLLWLE